MYLSLICAHVLKPPHPRLAPSPLPLSLSWLFFTGALKFFAVVCTWPFLLLTPLFMTCLSHYPTALCYPSCSYCPPSYKSYILTALSECTFQLLSKTAFNLLPSSPFNYNSWWMRSRAWMLLDQVSLRKHFHNSFGFPKPNQITSLA